MMFALKKKPGADSGILGYEWIKVLSVRPWALKEPSSDYGAWCLKLIEGMYVVQTELGVTTLVASDLEGDLQDYDLATDEEVAAMKLKPNDEQPTKEDPNDMAAV